MAAEGTEPLLLLLLLLRVPRGRPRVRAAPLEVRLGELLHGDVPEETGGAERDPARRAGPDLRVALALFTDEVAVVALEYPAGRAHDLVAHGALEVFLEYVVGGHTGRVRPAHPVHPVKPVQLPSHQLNLALHGLDLVDLSGYHLQSLLDGLVQRHL